MLHYAQEIFEGMKAYRHEDGSVWTFRPEANAERMVRSSHRLALPELPPTDFVQAVDALVEVDQRWVPDAAGEKSLYIRPFMIATETFLGVRPAQHVTFMVIASPAGAYFSKGVKPINLWLIDGLHPRRPRRHGRGQDRRQLRLARWSPSRRRPARAATRSSSSTRQEGKYVEELGGMNMYFVYADGHIVTPEIGTILEGITRSSIIELAGKLGHQVEERRFSVDEWRDGVASGDIVEVFACGTAAVVTPVGQLQVGRRRGRRGRRRRRPADDADPAGAGRHPVRPRRRHVRLDAPRLLTLSYRSRLPVIR